MAVTFAKVRAADIWDEALPLMRAHWEEIGHDRDLLVLDPDLERISLLERAGVWLTFEARRDDRLVGYAGYIVSAHLHYRTAITAFADVIYLDPSMRGHAFRFMRWIDAELVRAGAVKTFVHMKRERDFGPLLERLGYVWAEKLYGRRLG